MIELFTAPTPNGWKISIALEELGLPYSVRILSLNKKEQKEAWYLGLNPNGRIPTIVDHDNDDFVVFESGAILLYLAEQTGRLLPADPKGRSRVIQWLMFQMAGVGPMVGQASFFHRNETRIEIAIQRYRDESLRLYGVLDQRLKTEPYLAGDYSIADISAWPWVHVHEAAGLELGDLPHLTNWYERLAQRPAVIKGSKTPERSPPEADS